MKQSQTALFYPGAFAVAMPSSWNVLTPYESWRFLIIQVLAQISLSHRNFPDTHPNSTASHCMTSFGFNFFLDLKATYLCTSFLIRLSMSAIRL